MKLFELLNDEISQEFNGRFSPFYYKYLGFRKDPSLNPASLRANGVYSLFTETKPVILKNELIAGNLKSLHSTENDIVLDFAENWVKNLGERTFLTIRPLCT